MLSDHNAAKAQKAMEALLHMKKIDIETLKRAYAG
jgi:predicted 3-demethylubiquinone-9 3-methyltransferase (glyoxalase superfamily)